MGETILNKKMRAFDDEVALTSAPFYLVHMLQRTFPAGFIAPSHSRSLQVRGTSQKLAEAGYTIIATVGDQESDLEGGFAECRFKVPNPFLLHSVRSASGRSSKFRRRSCMFA